MLKKAHRSTWQIFPNAALVPKAWPLEPGTQLVPVPIGQTQSTALTLKKNCPYLKGLPPSHHLIGKSHSITNYDVTCGRGVLFPVNYWTPHRGLKIKNREKRTLNYWTPHRGLKIKNREKRTLNCLRQRVWLDVSTFDQCLFTTKQIGFVLILICETSQIFVWRNKAFIFLQKSDIIYSDVSQTLAQKHLIELLMWNASEVQRQLS